MYAYLADGVWSAPADIILPVDGPAVREMDLAVGDDGRLHLVWAGGYESGLYYASAPAQSASLATAWSSPVPLHSGQTTGHCLVLDPQGRLHVALTRVAPVSGVYYAQSADGGATWSELVEVSSYGADTLVSDIRMATDSVGRLHLVWQETPMSTGWPPIAILYARSEDSGQSWTVPGVVDEKDSSYREDAGPGMIGVGTAGADQVHLVWYGPPIGYRTHQWSDDGGVTWSEPREIADRALEFRQFTGEPMLMEDGTGAVHLVTSSNGIQHAIWRGGQWSVPDQLPGGDYNALNPRAAIGLGNTIHVVWFDDSDFEIWYSSLPISAPAIAPQPYALSTPPASMPAAPVATATQVVGEGSPQPLPTVARPAVDGDLPLSSAGSISPLLAGLVPALLLVLVIVLIASQRRRL